MPLATFPLLGLWVPCPFRGSGRRSGFKSRHDDELVFQRYAVLKFVGRSMCVALDLIWVVTMARFTSFSMASVAFTTNISTHGPALICPIHRGYLLVSMSVEARRIAESPDPTVSDIQPELQAKHGQFHGEQPTLPPPSNHPGNPTTSHPARFSRTASTTFPFISLYDPSRPALSFTFPPISAR